jgi:predicted Zn-dependent peptidase
LRKIQNEAPYIYVETTDFKDCIVSLRFFYPNQEPYVTLSNLLSYMLGDKTQRYPTKQAMARRQDELYGLNLDTRTSSLGLQHSFEVRIRSLNEVFMEEVRFEDAINFLSEVLSNSVLDQASFDEHLNNYRSALQRLNDKPQTLGLIAALKNFGVDHPITIYSQGSLEQLENITLNDVLNFYQTLLQWPVFVLYHGYPLRREARAALSTLPISGQPIKSSAYAFTYEDLKSVELMKSIPQSTLTMIYQSGIDYHHPDYIAFRVLCVLLGQMPNALLFQEVREKRSLCYSINASILNFDGLMVVQTGIDQQNLALVKNLVEQQLIRVQTLRGLTKRLSNAKRIFINNLQSMEDDPISVIGFLTQRIHEGLSIELSSILLAIEQVNLDDLSRVAKQLRLISQSVVRGEA